ncbi:MAG: septum formation protein Maf [Bacteroidetes bacterium]|nr:septum formation protein Maf [Bacteroidota bacterium]
MLLQRKILLASKSPRRSQLLKEAGFTFEVVSLNVDESYPNDMPVDEVAEFLARKKARAAVGYIKENEIVLAADSVVILGETIFGKPTDYQDAVKILRALSGKMHRVITGVCLKTKEKERSFSGLSKVFFDELSEEEIEYYIKNYHPYDKAGAYAIQEWIGLCKIKKIEGTYSNIMGLPVQIVYEEIGNWNKR